MTDAVVGLGANLGDPRAAFDTAAVVLDAQPGLSVVARSRRFYTAPVGPPQPHYWNAALRLTVDLDPEALLSVLLEVERAHGRDRSRELRWGPRTLDLDLLWFGGQTLATPRLRVPHPELANRAFALAPLLDVAPELEDPYRELLDRLGGEPPSEAWPAPSAG